MLIGILYHKAGKGKYANPLETLEKHFKWIANRYPTALPGESISSKLHVCLTFDDAFFDFYHFIYPLLQKYQLKAVLSVPTAFIPDAVSLSTEERLQKEAIFPKIPSPSPIFCSWDELKELNASPLIEIASHSVHHVPLIRPQVDVQKELVNSKQILESKLSTSIKTFVYPFGRFNKDVHTIAKKHYPYIMRIGNALNYSWTNSNGLFYRINGDQLPHYRYPFSFSSYIKHGARLFLNTLRKK